MLEEPVLKSYVTLFSSWPVPYCFFYWVDAFSINFREISPGRRRNNPLEIVKKEAGKESIRNTFGWTHWGLLIRLRVGERQKAKGDQSRG